MLTSHLSVGTAQTLRNEKGGQRESLMAKKCQFVLYLWCPAKMTHSHWHRSHHQNKPCRPKRFAPTAPVGRRPGKAGHREARLSSGQGCHVQNSRTQQSRPAWASGVQHEPRPGGARAGHPHGCPRLPRQALYERRREGCVGTDDTKFPQLRWQQRGAKSPLTQKVLREAGPNCCVPDRLGDLETQDPTKYRNLQPG